MPRTLPIANGNLHVSFDYQYCVRDIYHNHLGLNNQRLGVWVDAQMSWVKDDGWERKLCYEAHDSAVTNVFLTNRDLQISIIVNDSAAPEFDAFVRKFRILNHAENERDVQFFLNSRLRIKDNADSVAIYSVLNWNAVFLYINVILTAAEILKLIILLNYRKSEQDDES